MSAIVVAGGVSKRFGRAKGLVELAQKPLVLHSVDKLHEVVDEVIVVVNSDQQVKRFAEVIQHKARVIADEADAQTPLAGALAGFEHIQNEYALLLACDMPFLSPEILKLLVDICANKSATIPKWPNGNIEPLHAAYQAEPTAEAARKALGKGRLDMRSMIAEMTNVRYISTLVVQQIDPELWTFFNINTPDDLQQAESIMRHHPTASTK